MTTEQIQSKIERTLFNQLVSDGGYTREEAAAELDSLRPQIADCLEAGETPADIIRNLTF